MKERPSFQVPDRREVDCYAGEASSLRGGDGPGGCNDIIGVYIWTGHGPPVVVVMMMMGEHLGLLFLMRAGQQRKADIHHRLTSVVLRGFFLGLCPPPLLPPVFPFPVRGITACYLTHSRAYLKRPYPSPPAHVVTPRSFPGGASGGPRTLTPGGGWGRGGRQSMRKQFPPTRSEWSSFKIVSNVPSRNGALKRVMRRERAAKRTAVPTDR